MDTAEELRMNLASLQRIDPYIISIKESASQVIEHRKGYYEYRFYLCVNEALVYSTLYKQWLDIFYQLFLI